MSSIQMQADELYKKCCVYLLWTDIAFRYKQASTLRNIKNSKSIFELWKERTYDDAVNIIGRSDTFSHMQYHYNTYGAAGDDVKKLMLLCKNGNPVTVTTDDSFVLNLKFTEELANMGITLEKAVEIYESDSRI